MTKFEVLLQKNKLDTYLIEFLTKQTGFTRFILI